MNLFPDYEAPEVETGKPKAWTKADTARVLADPEFLKHYRLTEWEKEAKLVAAVMGWKTYQSKLLLYGGFTVSKRVKGHSIRFKRTSFGADKFHYELTTTRNHYSIGCHGSGDLHWMIYHADSTVDALEKVEFEKQVALALRLLVLVGVTPVPVEEPITGHENLAYIDELKTRFTIMGLELKDYYLEEHQRLRYQ